MNKEQALAKFESENQIAFTGSPYYGDALSEIEARKTLDELKDQWISVKDMIITEQDKLIKLLQGQKKSSSIWSRIKRILSIAEKAALIGLGVWVGRGL